MQTDFLKNLTCLEPNYNRLNWLLAVSGGVDSMTMAELFRLSRLNIAIAHCNFGLRGKESEGDEDFVREYCRKRGIRFYVKRFDTGNYSATHKLSIQEAARELRYGWLRSLCLKNNFNHACTAHNSDDALETFFINLLRGTGIAGLTGINELYIPAEKSDAAYSVIRPMLRFSRTDIVQYARQNKIAWRDDSSNATDKYLRNKIRHRLMPLLEELRPGSAHNIHLTMENLRAAETIYHQAVDGALGDIIKSEKGKIFIDKKAVLKLDNSALYLYEAIKKYNFNYTQAEELAAAIGGTPGKSFFSATHSIKVDRQNIILESKSKRGSDLFYEISKNSAKLSACGFNINFKTKEISGKFAPPRSALFACIDYDKLTFPLILRRWRQGDRFRPIGMTGQKKVSDLLTDLKVSAADKDDACVLLSGGEIVWVAGIRLSESYKITPATKKIYLCEMSKK